MPAGLTAKMDRLNQINPFSKRDSHSRNTVVAYTIFSLLSWVLAVVVTVYYSVRRPEDGVFARRSIWGQNHHYHTGFTLNRVIVSIYWIVLFILQLGYIGHLFSGTIGTVNAACCVGSHFILHNLLHFAFVMLFVRSHFIWAELLLIANFFNLTALYFRHNEYPRTIHMPVVSGPLAWTFVALYWNGAILIYHPDSLVARIFANIFVWSFLVYGMFFIILYKDYTMGFNLSVLSAALGVAQFSRQILALQWIFAFVIMSILFIFTIIVAVPAAQGKDFNWGQQRSQEAPHHDQERAPLLNENN